MGEYINSDDVITFCLYLTNKIRRNLIKIRSCATIIVGLTGLTVFLVTFRSINMLNFDWLIRKYETF